MQAKPVKNLIGALSLIAIVAMLAAIPASAQVTFSVTSLAQTARTEGQAETAGTVAMTFTGATGTVVSGTSSITVTYSQATVTSAGVVSGKIGGVACNVPLSTSPAGTSAAGNCGTAGLTPPAMTYTASGPNVIIQFNSAVTLTNGDFINVQQVRLNIAQVTGAVAPSPSQTILNATLSGNSPTANPITFTQSNVPVVTISTTLAVTGPAAITLNTCAVPSTTFSIKVSEVYPAAFTTPADETAFTPGSAGPPVIASPVSNGITLNIVFSNVPAGLQILAPSGAAVAAAAGTSATVTMTAPATVLVTSTGTTSTVTFSYTLTGDSTSNVETAVFPFTIGAPGTAAPVAGPAPVATLTSASLTSPQTMTAQVYVGPLSTTAAVIPRFTQLNYPTPALTIGTVSDCQSILLFPYVTNELGFDTSIQIANTSLDAAAFGTQKATTQAGACTLVLYPTAAATGALGNPTKTYVTPTLIAAGGTFQVKMSKAYAGQSGYMFAVCNFLNAHGFTYFVGPGSNTGLITQGALALVVNPATRGGAVAGAGEILTH